ncbi:fluoride efflux transporter FluC [Macrococcus brunensis]|uniref:fluoride efflux transporter FluC n=1 Tax=Macrococcus brunensis TaxID=198483 RepID=UPI001EF00191|nr:CrcB family protein [Macrococcus brunensis]ULG71412.1 CrcB family protein [Macrococcus brunensis]
MKYLYVALFAFIGAILRYSLTLISGDSSYIGTLAVNLIGAFLLAVLVSYPFKNHYLKVGVTSGMLGSFTTFSTFSADSIHLLEAHPPAGIGYITLTMVGGLFLSYTGLQAGRRLFC